MNRRKQKFVEDEIFEIDYENERFLCLYIGQARDRLDENKR
jgi:hypothetical protein